MFCWQYHDAEKDEEAVYSQLNLNVAIFERTFLPLYDTSIPIYEKNKGKTNAPILQFVQHSILYTRHLPI